MNRLLPLAASGALLALLPSGASAQDDAGDRVNTVIVYGDDECQQSSSDELVICVRMDEAERYRIPEALRQSESPANESWSNRVQAFEAVGDFGPLSCSPVGAGGELGCLAKIIEAAYAERRGGPSVRAAELIAQAREERLSTIDAEAAETQARVEELERQYMERVQREDAGEVAPPSAPSDAPVVVDPSDITN
ncbi:MAG TPA: hypothetical protein VKY80_00185 [Croceibacterium sp.]|nr:hypothetical protein [Croceibacterium sp.]